MSESKQISFVFDERCSLTGLSLDLPQAYREFYFYLYDPRFSLYRFRPDGFHAEAWAAGAAERLQALGGLLGRW